MEKKTSITQIAEQMNTSVTTVSFILNGLAKEKGISEWLTDKVLRHVEKVGYTRNPMARSLRSGKSNSIALMVEDIADPFHSRIAKLLEENAGRFGYQLLYSSTRNDPVLTNERLRDYRQRNVDAYIISPPEGAENELRSIMDIGKPVLLFDCSSLALATDSVSINNHNCITEAVEHFVGSGFKHIALITLTSLQQQIQERLDGYEAAIKTFGFPHYVKEIELDLDSGKMMNQIESFLLRKTELDAVIFTTNQLSTLGLKVIDKLGISIPKDLGVIVFQDTENFDFHKPSLTTIAHPIKETADILTRILFSKLHRNDTRANISKVVLDASLHIENSCSKS